MVLGELLGVCVRVGDQPARELLVGEIGSGKTMLSRALIDRIGESRPVILLINPRLTPINLVESQLTNVTGAQSVPSSQHKDRIVAPAERS